MCQRYVRCLCLETENWKRNVTTWTGVILETLMVTELDQKFPAFYYHIHKIPLLDRIMKQKTCNFLSRLEVVLPAGRILN